MRTSILILIITCFFYGTCKKAPEISACIQSHIETFKKSPLCDQSASVKEYLFMEKKVYVFDEGNCCCDRAASVLDINCSSLGILGGIAGITKINGVDFASNAVYIKTLWKN